MSTPSCNKFIIIGGGVFGLSSAWHLLKDECNDVTVYDYPNDIAPSRDVSKFFRVDYTDPDRMREVMRSKASWENDDLFKPFFKRTGRVVAYSPAQAGTLTGINHARSQLGLFPRKRQTIQLLEDLFDSTQLSQDFTVVYNEDDGVVDWTGVMKSLKEHCIEKGARFRDDQVIQLKLNTSGRVDTVLTSTTSVDTAQSEIILAAGPWIMQMLQASSIEQPPVSRAPIATGVFAFSLQLATEQWRKYENLPPLSQIGVGTLTSACKYVANFSEGEFLCHTTEVGMAKVTWIKPFRNPSGETSVSRPWDASGTDLAIKSMLEARDWIRRYLPGLKGVEIQSINSYW